MKINLVLAPEQEPAELLALQSAHQATCFYLAKESQLAGTNMLILDDSDLVNKFQRPISFDSVIISGLLQGQVIHQIAFQTKGHQDELIAQLIPDHTILAQNSQGKAEFMLWSFWPDHATLANYLLSDQFIQMKKLMKNPYTTSYTHVTSAQQLSLTHQMRDFDDKTWWG
ncbi:hypothetical protein [Leuconostoc rapi]|uniref:hypothetical protein n=1 Tax=Leuconostoc rapi TaxID=1406906 RepID=UPI00195D41C1|nr:hypothetical protein [Leuconostoc rapi]MBM7436226.1 hypothetical protein [Leuconostoc rapi]